MFHNRSAREAGVLQARAGYRDRTGWGAVGVGF